MSPKVQSIESHVAIREPTLSSDLPKVPLLDWKRVDSQTHVCRCSLVIFEVRIEWLTFNEILLTHCWWNMGFQAYKSPTSWSLALSPKMARRDERRKRDKSGIWFISPTPSPPGTLIGSSLPVSWRVGGVTPEVRPTRLGNRHAATMAKASPEAIGCKSLAFHQFENMALSSLGHFSP